MLRTEELWVLYSISLIQISMSKTNELLIQKERKEDIAKWCSDLSYTLILKKEFISTLKASQLAQVADKEYEYQYANLALAYLLNDQYDSAEKIFLDWKDIPWPLTPHCMQHSGIYSLQIFQLWRTLI